MAINVTLGEAKTQTEKPFPKLMISRGGPWDGCVCLFEKPEKGLLLGKTTSDFGFANNFDMEYFVDYNEPITIQNA